MYTVEQIKSLIVPIPQQINALDGASLTLTGNSRFRFSAPTADKGPAKTAEEEMRALLTEKCGADRFAADGIPVTLELGAAPNGVKNEKEAYRIQIRNQGVSITGFGENGLLYGVVSFKQICQWDVNGCEIPALSILDWPDNPIRGIKEECRYGSNMMERQDWMDMLDDIAGKK